MDTTPEPRALEVEVGTEEQETQYTAWLRAKVQQAIEDPRPSIPHHVVMAEIRGMIATAKTQDSTA